MIRNGMTLIEVLIAMMIIAFISTFTTSTIRRGVQFKNKIQSNLDQRTAINNAMKIIERDINLSFHNQDIHYEIQSEVEKAKYDAQYKSALDQSKATGVPPVGVPSFQSKLKPPAIVTQFLGDEEKLDFTNLNHTRLVQDVQESDQQKVGYSLHTCKSVMKPILKGTCLWRRTSSILDDKVDQGGEDTVLLEGIKSFKLRYFGKGKDDWVKQWFTDERGDGITKDNFPSAVEVTLVTSWKEKSDAPAKEMSSIRVIPLRFPNNKESNTGPQSTPGPGNQPPINNPDANGGLDVTKPLGR